MVCWPRPHAARAALLLIMALGFFLAMLINITVPPFWGPDEDYHFGYASNLSVVGKLSNPNEPFYSPEQGLARKATDHEQFGSYPAAPTALTGDPKAAGRRLEQTRKPSDLLPIGEPTRPVVHAPLYHASAAVVMKPFQSRSVFTRVWTARAVNAFVAMLIVFAAWLLSAQVFPREGPRLFVSGLAATQPMINYAGGTMTNDALLVATFTLTLAVAVHILAGRSAVRHGLALGGFLGLALLSKSSALMLLPILAAVYGWRALRNRDERGMLVRSAAAAIGVSALVAGWFYVYLIAKYGTLTGSVGSLFEPGDSGQPITALPGLLRVWLIDTYSTYWMHYIYWESPRRALVFWVPAVIGAIGLAGLAKWYFREIQGRAGRSSAMPAALLLTAVALLAIAPWVGVDLRRALAGQDFAFTGGRFIIPAYPAAAVLLAIGLAELIKRRGQIFAFVLVSMISLFVALDVWWLKAMERYYGGVDGLGFEFYRASFFRPEWVSENWYYALPALAVSCGIGALVLGVRVARQERQEPSVELSDARWRAPLPQRAG